MDLHCNPHICYYYLVVTYIKAFRIVFFFGNVAGMWRVMELFI